MCWRARSEVGGGDAAEPEAPEPPPTAELQLSEATESGVSFKRADEGHLALSWPASSPQPTTVSLPDTGH